MSVKSKMWRIGFVIFVCMGNVAAQEETRAQLLEDSTLAEVVFDIYESFDDQCFDQEIDIPEIQDVIRSSSPSYFARMFPNAKPPEKELDQYGRKLVDITRLYSVIIKREGLEGLIAKLQDLEMVRFAEESIESQRIQLMCTPISTSDPLATTASGQWHLDAINAYEGWSESQGNPNVVIGFSDTGFNPDHKDMKGKIALNTNDLIDGIDNDNDGYIDNYMGWNFYNNSGTITSNNDHGVLTAGVAAAGTDNGVGIAGVGFDSKYLGVTGAGTSGIVYLADHGVDIINLSWGSYTWDPIMFSNSQTQMVIDYATINRGILVVAAGGNSGNNMFVSPACLEGVLSVAGTQRNPWVTPIQLDEVWVNTTYNHLIDVCAPARNIRTTSTFSIPGIYTKETGTSIAAPIVAGLAALIKDKYPNYTNVQIAERIRATADPVVYAVNTQSKYIDALGTGRVDVCQALTKKTPGIHLEVFSLTDDCDGVLNNFDTIVLQAKIRNVLNDAGQLTVEVSLPVGFVALDPLVYTIGALPSNSSVNLPPIRIVPQLPTISGPVSLQWIKFRYTDQNYTYDNYKYKYFHVFPTIEEDVVWTNIAGAVANGNDLTRTLAGPGTWGDCGAESQQVLSPMVNGSLRHVVSSTSKNYYVGLSSNNVDNSQATIEYAFYVNKATLRIRESGNQINFSMPTTVGQELQIERWGGNIVYKVNGNVVRTTATNQNQPLLVDVSLRSPSTTISNTSVKFCSTPPSPQAPITANPTIIHSACGQNSGAIYPNITGGSSSFSVIWNHGNYPISNASFGISNLAPGTYSGYFYDLQGNSFYQEFQVLAEVMWTNINMAQVGTNNELQRTGTASSSWYTSGANSANIIEPMTDGALVHFVGSLAYDYYIGLDVTGSGLDQAFIDYSFYNNQGVLYIREEATGYNVNHGTLSVGDELRIERVGNVMNYYRNGTLLKQTVVTSNASPLMADATIHSNTGVIENVYLSSCYVPGSTQLRQSGQDELSSVSDTKLFPNPAENTVNIVFEEKGNYELELITVSGAVVLKKRMEDSVSGTFDLTHVNPGVYIVRITSGKGQSQHKLIKN